MFFSQLMIPTEILYYMYIIYYKIIYIYNYFRGHQMPHALYDVE